MAGNHRDRTPDAGRAALAALADLHRARTLLSERRAAEAMMVVEALLAGRPDDRAALALRAEIMAAIEATPQALAVLELTAALNPDQSPAHLELAYAYDGLDRPADAERCFKRALELAPGSAEIHAALGALYLGAGIVDGAEHHSRRALDADPAQAVASQTLATLLEARGQIEAAAACLDRAYRKQALFVQPALEPRMRVLVLATVSAGNIPYRLIMPVAAYSRLVWYMEYARDAEWPAANQYDVIFNTIGDADLAEPSAAAVDRFLAACGRPVVNDPAKVARTRRDRLPELLAGIADVVAPTTLRLDAGCTDAASLIARAADAGIGRPFLLRPVGSHGGRGLERIGEDETPAATPENADLAHYVTAYVDYGGSDGLFRKYRVLFVDREPYPYHQAVSSHWMVHHETSGMTDFADRVAEEARFLTDPEDVLGPRGMAAIRAIGAAVDLDYCGVDFSLLPDGRILVFEANATMLAHAEDAAGPYAYKNAHVARIAEAFQALLAKRARLR